MAKKRKISIRKVLQALLTLVVVSGCLVAVLGASKRHEVRRLSKIHLEVLNEDRYRFLDKEALWRSLIDDRGLITDSTALNTLDVKGLEAAAIRHPWVARAEAYVDHQHELHVELLQRVPVSRIFLENGESYYLDNTLKHLPLSEKFTIYTVLVTNVPLNINDSTRKSLYASINRLVNRVEKDPFWRAQIAQIQVTPELEFELIPVLGKHLIRFGDTTRMEQKFSHLMSFYKQVLNRIGWDKYETLDLRFRNQLVAAPSLPWKPPSKNAISNMDWLKSVIGEVPKEFVQLKANAPYQVTTPVPAGSTPQQAVNPVSPQNPAPVSTSIQTQTTATQPTPAAPAPSPAQDRRTENSKEEQPKETEQRPKYIYEGPNQ